MYLETIRKIISQKTGTDPEEIIPPAHFEEDLNIGELELLDILNEIEEEYDVDLIEHKNEIDTIEDLVNLLAEEIE